MSNDALNLAWKYNCDEVSAAAKFVLVALADFADEEMSCYPGQERLAEMTGQSVRSVARHLEVLEEVGVIQRERRMNGNKRTSDRYYLSFTEPDNLEPDKTVTEGDNVTLRNLPTLAEYPLEEPSVTEPTDEKARNTVDGDFAVWYKAYPKKSNKPAALKAYRKARKLGKTASDLMEAMTSFPFPSDPQFVPYPSSWLNGQRWEDDYDALRARQGGHNRSSRRPTPDEQWQESRERGARLQALYEQQYGQQNQLELGGGGQ